MNAYRVTLEANGAVTWACDYDPELFASARGLLEFHLVAPDHGGIIHAFGKLTGLSRCPSGGIMWFRGERYDCPVGLYVPTPQWLDRE